MLVILGFGMVAVFMALIMTKRMTPVLALIVVPTIFGLFAGAGLGIGEMALDAIGGLAPTAALLMFAIIYFGVMIDVGLFDPSVRLILRVAGNDPVKVVVGTASSRRPRSCRSTCASASAPSCSRASPASRTAS